MTGQDSELQPPATPDYYTDLGVQQTATNDEIKRAHHMLAKRYHPDKLGPGQCIDATEFRKIREAYEFLRDEAARLRYDDRYPQVQREWREYRSKLAAEALRQKRIEEAERAAYKSFQERLAKEKVAREKMSAEERKASEESVSERKHRLSKELEEWLSRTRAQMEETFRREAQRERQQQENAAREKLRQERAKEAQMRSEEAAKRAQEAQKQAAEERLHMSEQEKKQAPLRATWSNLRNAADSRPTPICDHHRQEWLRKKGKAECIMCKAPCVKFSFCCAGCGASACQACRNKCILWK